jgi:NAD+ synthase (glutamine-hydrolysing)
MKHGFIKVAAVSPKISVAACDDNVSEILGLINTAEGLGARIIVFPELCVCGASCGDLLYSDTLLECAKNAVCEITDKTKSSDTIIIIGFPLVVNDKLYNCAAICQSGQILGVVPKTVLTSRDMRYFSAPLSYTRTIKLGNYTTSFGQGQIFVCKDMPTLKIAIEIGDECFAPISPATLAAQAGATVIVNPFATAEIVGAEEYRKDVLSVFSAKNHCAYIHA